MTVSHTESSWVPADKPHKQTLFLEEYQRWIFCLIDPGALHPIGSLYEKPVNLTDAAQQHLNFCKLLEDHGIRVLKVRDILSYGVETSLRERLALEDLAAECLTYRLEPTR